MNYLLTLLGWVLLQAAWQIGAVAALQLLCLRSMWGVSAARRYRCAVWHLASALGAVALTFLASHASVAAGLTETQRRAVSDGFPVPSDHTLLLLRSLGLIWLAGIGATQALLAIHWIRLRRFLRASAPASPALEALVREMSAAIDLAPTPQVRFADVPSPMVAGSRPAFLLAPHSLCDHHPPEEVRALVAHELAHVQRGDYSANLLHLAAVLLVWWHPAAWLIYTHIRHERECSTDERAIQLTDSALPLAHALLRLAGDLAASPAVLAAHSGGLADRLARLVGPANGVRRDTAPSFLPAAFAALACLIAAVSSSVSHHDGLTRAYAASFAGPAMPITIHAHDPAGTFEVRMVRGRVTAIDLGDLRVPSGQVVQTGDTVRVVGRSGEELLRLQVDPRGGLRWQARRAS
jgi:beta-lactamase regulating signal transducer with metallopeptidase domain